MSMLKAATNALVAAALGLTVAQVHSQQLAQDNPPTVEDLRSDAAASFFISPAFDETARLAVADMLPEVVVMAGCQAAGTVKAAALELFKSAGFLEVAARQRYREYSLHVVRDLPDLPKRIDIVLFYFGVEKTTPVSCRYVFGNLGRRERVADGQIVEGSDRDALYRMLQTTLRSLAAKLPP